MPLPDAIDWASIGVYINITSLTPWLAANSTVGGQQSEAAISWFLAVSPQTADVAHVTVNLPSLQAAYVYLRWVSACALWPALHFHLLSPFGCNWRCLQRAACRLVRSPDRPSLSLRPAVPCRGHASSACRPLLTASALSSSMALGLVATRSWQMLRWPTCCALAPACLLPHLSPDTLLMIWFRWLSVTCYRQNY